MQSRLVELGVEGDGALYEIFEVTDPRDSSLRSRRFYLCHAADDVEVVELPEELSPADFAEGFAEGFAGSAEVMAS